MRSLKSIAALSSFAAVLVTAASAADAAAIDVQFSRDPGIAQTGGAVVGQAGDYWNDFLGNTSTGALLDASGHASGASLSFSSYGVYESDPGFTQFTGKQDANLMQGYLYAPQAAPISLVFSGLTAGQAYGFWVYTQGDDNSRGRSISLAANGGVAQVATQTNASSFSLGDNYVYLTATANAGGVVDIVGNELDGEANINGVQVMAVPEPSSMVLMMAGFAFLAGAVVRRRRVR